MGFETCSVFISPFIKNRFEVPLWDLKLKKYIDKVNWEFSFEVPLWDLKHPVSAQHWLKKRVLKYPYGI